MKRLYDLNIELLNGRNYIFGEGVHAMATGKFYQENGIPFEGFVTFDAVDKTLLDKKIVPINQLVDIENVNILLVDANWQVTYDHLYKYVDASRIYVNTTWISRNAPCIVCGNSLTFSGNARFVRFLTERMFQGKRVNTKIVHCPKCGMYYSEYRPNEEEMSRLYTNYRDEAYQKQRQKYEKEYTKEFNESLFAPADGGKERMDGMINFMEGIVDFDKCKNVLDFGGDKGQFIPYAFENAHKYVYEISGTYVVDGITLLTDMKDLSNVEWDVVFCNMVMEHLSDIRGYFTELVECMGKNTYLYIEVPFERYMENSEMTYIHEHINYFREGVFYELARQNNISVVKSETKDIIRCLFHY